MPVSDMTDEHLLSYYEMVSRTVANASAKKAELTAEMWRRYAERKDATTTA